MDQPGVTDPRERFEELATRLRDKVLSGAAGARPSGSRIGWADVQELFTRDVTGRGLQELLGYEAQETIRFFAREVRLAEFQALPWYRRYPRMAWTMFLAVAHRLSPWRRVLFAVSVPVVAVGWFRHIFTAEQRMGTLPPQFSWEGLTLLAATFLLFLLALELRDKLGLKGDLEIARQIQFGLLPFAPYSRGGVHIETVMRPANTVGGDYFDIIDLPEGTTAIVVGDVAGKGMPAALLMALLQGSLRTLITAGLRGADLVSKLNAHLYANIPTNRLVTLFYGELDPATGDLAYVNAGHNPPFLLRQTGARDRLAPTAPALGILRDAEFVLLRAELDPGELLVLYTDGVTEANDAHDDEYGEERLSAWLAAQAPDGGRAIVEGIVADVLAFGGPVKPRDDMTVMAVFRDACP